jgi:hypothetical protein
LLRLNVLEPSSFAFGDLIESLVGRNRILLVFRADLDSGTRLVGHGFGKVVVVMLRSVSVEARSARPGMGLRLNLLMRHLELGLSFQHSCTTRSVWGGNGDLELYYTNASAKLLKSLTVSSFRNRMRKDDS